MASWPEYEERSKERGAVLDSDTGRSMYDLCISMNHKSISEPSSSGHLLVKPALYGDG